jgi:mono/diheme cytochrome c family protein
LGSVPLKRSSSAEIGMPDPAAAVPTGPPAQGIAVDPYIVGAIFQEIAADGTLLQRQSTASDAAGRFSFPQPLTPGSIVELKPASKGMHNGVPYQGMIRRRVDDSATSTWVVSPLTTFTASGLSEEQVLSLFTRAGLSGLTAADLTADPLAAINPGGSIDATTRLAPLQAAMAANAYMQAANDYVLTPADLNNTAHLAVFDAMVTAATEFLSVATFNTLANDSAVIASGTPLSADDLIRTAATLCQQVSDQVRQSPTLPMATAINNTLASAPIYARQHYEARTGITAPITSPVPDPDSTPTPIPNPTPTPTPTPAPDGAALYTASCAICHKFASLDATGFAPDLNNQGGQIVAKLQAGHNGIVLSAAGATALGNWIANNSIVVTPPPLPVPDPTPAPAPDGATLYATSCEDCHKFGSIDTAGFAPDLNNKGNLISAKLLAGHNGIALSAAETAALDSWIVSNSTVVTPPPLPVPDPTPAPTPDGATLYAAS